MSQDGRRYAPGAYGGTPLAPCHILLALQQAMIKLQDIINILEEQKHFLAPPKWCPRCRKKCARQQPNRSSDLELRRGSSRCPKLSALAAASVLPSGVPRDSNEGGGQVTAAAHKESLNPANASAIISKLHIQNGRNEFKEQRILFLRPAHTAIQ